MKVRDICQKLDVKGSRSQRLESSNREIGNTKSNLFQVFEQLEQYQFQLPTGIKTRKESFKNLSGDVGLLYLSLYVQSSRRWSEMMDMVWSGRGLKANQTLPGIFKIPEIPGLFGIPGICLKRGKFHNFCNVSFVNWHSRKLQPQF